MPLCAGKPKIGHREAADTVQRSLLPVAIVLKPIFHSNPVDDDAVYKRHRISETRFFANQEAHIQDGIEARSTVRQAGNVPQVQFSKVGKARTASFIGANVTS